MANGKTETTGEWLVGYNQALEDAAALVETHLVYLQCTPQLQPLIKKRNVKPNQPRHVYAEAIRAMKGTDL